MSERRFTAWALPRGVGAPLGPGLTVCVGGTDIQYLDADRDWIRGLARSLAESRGPIVARPARAVAAVLGLVGRRFLDPLDPLRAEALSLLPPTAGVSLEMAEAVLDGMAADWTESHLSAMVASEFGSLDALDGFSVHGDGRTLVVGPGLSFQVVSGSVPGVSVNALLRSLLVKGPTLVKPGRGDIVLPVLFARALREADPELADAVAVVYWPGGRESLEDEAMGLASVVTAYGGDAAVAALRTRTPISTRFIAYHHRLSAGVVGRQALTADGVDVVVGDVARAVAMFDQRGCVSPQVVYVEEGATIDPPAFGALLAAALRALEDEVPGGSLDPVEASAMHQVRGTAELMAASGSGVEVHHGGAASWTVIYDPFPAFSPSCVGRVVRVKPLPRLSALPRLIAPFGAHLQTVGVAGVGEQLESLAEALGRVGVSRVAAFSQVPFPPPTWHHDGGGPLRDLVRYVDLEVS